MPRCIATILKVVTNLTPESETDIHRQLSSIGSSIDFAPPELEGLHWQRIGEAFDVTCNPPKEDWQLAICAILNDEPLERIKALVASKQQSLT